MRQQLVLCAVVLLFFFSVIYLTNMVTQEIEQEGLRNILQEIWCGERGCDE